MIQDNDNRATDGKGKGSGQAAACLEFISFGWTNREAPVLEIENLSVEHGEHLFIMGPSGSGKSTLLGLLAGVAIPQRGSVTILGERIDLLSGPARDRFRADHVGYIFQLFNLIPYLSIVENVTLPCLFSGARKTRALKRSGSVALEAIRLLGSLGLAAPELLHQPVVELSVGQQQRVAAARALIGSPEIVIADEPTSSLDTDHREAFIRLLFDECNSSSTTILFVSHDATLAPLFSRTVRLDEINKAGGNQAWSNGVGL